MTPHTDTSPEPDGADANGLDAGGSQGVRAGRGLLAWRSRQARISTGTAPTQKTLQASSEPLPELLSEKVFGAGMVWAVGAAGGGSPGSTSLALALAVHAEALLVEADADGGVLAARCGAFLHPSAPSLASLLAALPEVGPDTLAAHTQLLPSGILAALLGPAGEDATGPVAHLPHALADLREALPGRAIVLDLGRIRAGSAALQLLGQVDATILTTGPGVEALACLLGRLPVLAAATSSTAELAVAVRGQGPYPLADVRAEIQARAGRAVEVLALPEDLRALAALHAGPPPTAAPSPAREHAGSRSRRANWARRSPLMHAAGDLHDTYASRLRTATTGTTPAEAPPSAQISAPIRTGGARG